MLEKLVLADVWLVASMSKVQDVLDPNIAVAVVTRFTPVYVKLAHKPPVRIHPAKSRKASHASRALQDPCVCLQFRPAAVDDFPAAKTARLG